MVLKSTSITDSKGNSLTESQIAQIKALEETTRQLIQQAADMREEGRKTEDPNPLICVRLC